MSAEVKVPAVGRRVICGVTPEGKSAVVEDRLTPTRAVRPTGAVLEEIWRQDALPAPPQHDGRRGSAAELVPPAEGVVVRLYSIPPDSASRSDSALSQLGEIYGAGNVGASSVPGMHRTQTVDVVTIVSGELVALMEEGEVVLKAGHSIVFRGEMHAWRNRTNDVAVLISTVMPLQA